MRCVYKYKVNNVYDIPLPATPLFCAIQAGEICVWVLIDDAPYVTTCRYVFREVGTGHEVPVAAEYVGSVQDPPYVWHIFRDVAP